MKTTNIFGFNLPISDTPCSFPPGEQEIVGYEDILKILAYSIKNSKPSLLIGETGVGKTALIRYLASKTNSNFRRVNLNGQTTVEEFVGKTLLNRSGTYWQDGILVDAMRNGYWLLVDEINAALPEILFTLHSLLDDDGYVVLAEKDGEIVRPHPSFRFFATMNPSGKYAGTKSLNKAFLSRFPIVLQLKFPLPSVEKKIIAQYSQLKGVELIRLIKVANELRSLYQKGDLEYICSTRDLINCAQISADLGIREAMELTIINRCDEEEKKAVETLVSLYFGKNPKKVLDLEKRLQEVAREIVKEKTAYQDAFSSLENCAMLIKKNIASERKITPPLSPEGISVTDTSLKDLLARIKEAKKRACLKK